MNSIFWKSGNFLLFKCIMSFEHTPYRFLNVHHKINFKSNFGTHIVFHKSKISNPCITKLS